MKTQKKRKKVSEVVIDYGRNTLKRFDESWDFRKANTKEFTHCFHSYPAMMIPQVTRRLIQTFRKDAKLLFDPYCGTGTSLVEANLAGINAIGIDLNLLARMIAETKTTRLNLDCLREYIADISELLFKTSFGLNKEYKIEIPRVTNIDYWFSKTVQKKLAIILDYINKIPEKEICNFFKVAFSETVPESSYVKPDEFKLVR